MNDDYIPVLSRAKGEAQARRTPHQTTKGPMSDRELARLQRDTAEVPILTREQGLEEAEKASIRQVKTFDRPPMPQAAFDAARVNPTDPLAPPHPAWDPDRGWFA
jgi:hypothetical protein